LELISFVPCLFAENISGWRLEGAFFTGVTFPDFPGKIKDFSVIAVFAKRAGDKEKEDFELAIVDQSTNVVAGVFLKFATFDAAGLSIVRMDFTGITAPRPGTYTFELRFSELQCRPWALLISKGEGA
jgi:hypothetical protein